MKNYLKSFLYTLGIILISSIILTILNYFSVNTPTKEYSYDQIQPGDIITYGREGEPSVQKDAV